MMSARRDLALAVGFDDNLGPYGLEDEDFSFRLSRLGRIRYRPDAVIHHRTMGFAASDPRAFTRTMVLQRAYLFRKNFEQTRTARLRFAAFMVVLAGYRVINLDWAGLRGLVEGCHAAWRRRAPQDR
jgi:hypothetical protein